MVRFHDAAPLFGVVMLKAEDIQEGQTLYSMFEDWAHATKEKGVPVCVIEWAIAGADYQRLPAGTIDLTLNINKAREMSARGENFFTSKEEADAFMNDHIKNTRHAVYFD